MFINNEVIPISLKNYQASIEHPSDLDCLCGKDTTFGRHPGNRMFRKQILATLHLFMAARTKTEKMKVTRSVVDYMKHQGSRFLKLKANGSWVEIDTQATRDKVSHALRFAARQRRKQEEDSQSFLSSSSSSGDELQQQDQEDKFKPLPLTIVEEVPSSNVLPMLQSLKHQELSTTKVVQAKKVSSSSSSSSSSSCKLFGNFYPVGGIQPLKLNDLPRCESGGFTMSATALLLNSCGGLDEDHFATMVDATQGHYQQQQLTTDELEYLAEL